MLNHSSLDKLEITSELGTDTLELMGSGIASKSNLERRCKSKYFSNHLAINLANLNSTLKDKYWDTYHCSSVIIVEGERAKSKFCKRRWCIICNRIRTAQLIKTYYPTLETWNDKHFVTLTVPNPRLHDLRPELNRMMKVFTLIKDSERKADRKLIGIRKLEITYNRDQNNYHPHYHLILKSRQSCSQFLSKWLDHFPKASKKAQDIRLADKNSCFELFKYFTKLTSNSSKDKSITISALDNIFCSIEGIRTFQPFGFVAHKEVSAPENIITEANEFSDSETFKYLDEVNDWVNENSGELLTEFTPNSHDTLLRKRIA